METTKLYEPHNPNPGDLVFKSDDWVMDIRKHPDRVGRITSRLEPIQGALIRYKIEITLLNGKTIPDSSHNWKCMRQLANFSSELAKVHRQIIEKLDHPDKHRHPIQKEPEIS